MEQKIEIEIQVLATFCRGTGQVCHLKLMMKADIKKTFFFLNMINYLQKLVLHNKKTIFFLFKNKMQKISWGSQGCFTNSHWLIKWLIDSRPQYIKVHSAM